MSGAVYQAAWAQLRDGQHPVVAEIRGGQARVVVIGHPIKVVRCSARALRAMRLSARRAATRVIKIARGHGPTGVRHAMTKGARALLAAART